MRKRIPLSIALLLFAVIFAAVLQPAAHFTVTAAAPSPPAPATALEAQVDKWIKAISNQPDFHSWQEAEAVITPLGPGQHGWLVSLRHNKQDVGYMIVHAKEDGGFSLGEYGTGSQPIFNANTLYQSLVQQDLIPSYEYAIKKPLQLERLYVHPLLAAWKWLAPDGQIYYMDAWTGDVLPVSDEDWQAAVKQQSATSTLSIKAGQIVKAKLNDSFDLFASLPWLTKTPLAAQAQLENQLDRKQQIRFAAEMFDSRILFIWLVIGYHRWDTSDLFIAFSQDDSTYGIRYIPLHALTKQGKFFN
ncbi:hypothetical protein [Paenibacillus sp. GCM10027626]|uniref:hypothetical protein n=1 Tax=Paenibacillus sp. GCM10027626 TaxID=3273411 RepID=UPI003644E528